MTSSELKTFAVRLYIKAECSDDARELINDYTGQQTEVKINKIEEVVD